MVDKIVNTNSFENIIQLDDCWITVDGVKIRYLEAGDKKDNPILFIHGLGSASDRWMMIPETLSSHFHSIAMDLPGFGKSDKPATLDYTIDQFRDMILSFLKEISIDSKITLIGHSLGGYIASEIAIQNPNQVKNLILIDSSGMLTKPTPILEEYLSAAMNPTKNNVRKAFEKMVADPQRIPDQLVDGFIKRIQMPNAKYSFQATLENSATTQIGLDRMQKISNLPTLIIWGLHDKVIPLSHSKFFKENIEGSMLEIVDDAGHAPFAEKPKEVTEILKNFLLSKKFR